MRPECIEAVSRAIGRQLTTAEAQKLEDKISNASKQLWLTEKQKMIGLSKADQFYAAAELAAKQIKADALNKKIRVAKTILAHDALHKDLEALPGLRSDALKEVLAGNLTMSIESTAQSIRHQILGSLADVSEPFLPKWLGFDQGNTRMEFVFRELRGEDTGNPQAKAYAKRLSETFERVRTRFNSLGGQIGKLDDWAHPQAHSAYLLFKATKDGWVHFITPKLDRSRYVNEDGSGFTDEQFTRFLEHSWDSVVYDGELKKENGQSLGYGMKANAHSQNRQLHFKDAQSYLDYHKQFGEKSLHATVIAHIDMMARDIALLERMGPNPNHQIKWFADWAYKEDAAQGIAPDTLNSKKIRNERIFNTVAGISPPIGNQGLAHWMDVARSLNLVALGSSGISTITDINTMMLTAQYNQLSQSKLLIEHLRALTDADSRRHARRLGIGVDAFASSVLRHGQEQLANGFAAKIGGATIRLSGMPFITEANRQAFSITMMDALAHIVGTHDNLAAIDKTDARMLFTHSIDEADFALWKQAEPELWTDGISKLLTTDAIMAIQGVDEKVLRTSADKLMALVLDEQNMAVITPGAEQRAFMNAGTTRGTLMGELARSFWQFKSFGLSLPWKHLQRLKSMDSTSSAAAYGAFFFAGGLLLGGLAVQLKELVKGNDPLDMTDLDFAGRALLQSGGTGILGDFLNSRNTRYGNSIIGAMAGPTIAKAEQLTYLTWGNVIDAQQGTTTHMGAEALRFAESIDPLSTLWFTKAAWNHLVIQQLQESLSPGYLRRMEQRAQREFKQHFYWRPGEPLPERAPDLSRAFGG